MQPLTLSHWAEQLEQKVMLAANAAADCVHLAAIGEGTQRHNVVTGSEQALYHIESTANYLVKIRSATDGRETVDDLESIQRNVRAAKSSFALFVGEVDEISGEIRTAVENCATALESLATDTDRLMSLPEVQEARLSHRARVAKDTAGKIEEELLGSRRRSE